MKKLSNYSFIFLFGSAVSAFAQSAEVFDTPSKPEEPVQQTTSETELSIELDREAQLELLASPSRFAGLDLDNYVQALSSTFSMRTRDTDPFAKYQDPNFKPIQPIAPKSKIAKLKPEPVTPFSDIVERINVTAVIPAQQVFLVDERSFTIGSRIKLDTGKDSPIAIHVTAIAADSVTFRHGITGETAVLHIKLMPEGMTPGGKTIHPPGMAPKNSDAPVDVRPGNSISSRR